MLLRSVRGRNSDAPFPLHLASQPRSMNVSCHHARVTSMSTRTRFQTRGRWSLIPGPAELAQPMNSQDLQDMEVHSPAAIAESFLSFPGVRLLQPPTPTWWKWRARWESGSAFIEVGMTLFEDEAQSWGGSAITADCSLDDIEALWS